MKLLCTELWVLFYRMPIRNFGVVSVVASARPRTILYWSEPPGVKCVSSGAVHDQLTD